MEPRKTALACVLAAALCASCDEHAGMRLTLRGCDMWDLAEVSRLVGWFQYGWPLADGSFPEGLLVHCVDGPLRTAGGVAAGELVRRDLIRVAKMPLIESALVHELSHATLWDEVPGGDPGHETSEVWDWVETRFSALGSAPDEICDG